MTALLMYGLPPVALAGAWVLLAHAVWRPAGRVSQALMRVCGPVYRRWPWRKPTPLERHKQQARWN